MVDKDVVYFLKMDSTEQLVKIGKSSDIKRRISSLRTASPFPMELIALIENGNEAEIHEQFGHLRVCNEWFRFNNEISEFIKDYLVKQKVKDINYHDFVISVIDYFLLKKYKFINASKGKYCDFVDLSIDGEIFIPLCMEDMRIMDMAIIALGYNPDRTDKNMNWKKIYELVNFTLKHIPIEIMAITKTRNNKKPDTNHHIHELRNYYNKSEEHNAK